MPSGVIMHGPVVVVLALSALLARSASAPEPPAVTEVEVSIAKL